MNIIALIGGHSKDLKLLKMFQAYSCFPIVLFVLIYLVIIVLKLYSYRYDLNRSEIWYDLALCSAFMVASVAIQIYMLLILRSNVKKLAESCKFRFVNHAAEAECTIHIDQIQISLNENFDGEVQTTETLHPPRETIEEREDEKRE